MNGSPTAASALKAGRTLERSGGIEDATVRAKTFRGKLHALTRASRDRPQMDGHGERPLDGDGVKAKET